MSPDQHEEQDKPRVLIVDDNEMHHRVLKLIADRLEFTVHRADSCHQALDALSSQNFDLVMMDVRMPKVDGFECTKIIRSMPALADLVIIAVTADVLSANAEKCLAAGMNDFLPKPFTLDQLHEKLNFWLKRVKT